MDGGTREGDDGRRRAFNRAARRRSTASLYSDTIKIETKIVQTTAYASTHMGVGAASSDDAREAMISVDAMCVCARRRKVRMINGFENPAHATAAATLEL